MGFWTTGYMEFHEPTGFETSYVPSKNWYPCQHCNAQFEEIEALRQHRFQMHPVVRPLLFIRGIEIGASTFAIKQPLDALDITVDRAIKASLDGSPVVVKGLALALAASKNGRVRLDLANDGASATFDLLFEVAHEPDLAAVEAAFLKLARGRLLSIQSIETFIADCRPNASAARYYDGLCHYLYGVLAKERAGDSGLKYDQYPGRYSRAADELKGFERPLARLVRALVEFHFNHFRDAQRLAPTGRLARAAAAFAEAINGKAWTADGQTVNEESDALEDLLTDHETLRILRWAIINAAELGNKVGSIADQFQRELPSYDRIKLLILHGEASACSADAASARKAARELIGSEQTSMWAESLLARVGKEG